MIAVSGSSGRTVLLVRSEEAMQKLSTYAEQLPIEAKQRYLDKIDAIGGIYPFKGPLGECTDEVLPVWKPVIWFLI